MKNRLVDVGLHARGHPQNLTQACHGAAPPGQAKNLSDDPALFLHVPVGIQVQTEAAGQPREKSGWSRLGIKERWDGADLALDLLIEAGVERQQADQELVAAGLI